MITKAEILLIVREHMADCAGISERDIDDHGERIAFRIERLVNKRLAAAPELLSALRKLMDAWPEGMACEQNASAAFDDAYAAIAAGTGA